MPTLPARRYMPPPMYSRGRGSIADLLMQRGDIAARGAERSGQIWGGAVAGLGQIGGQAIAQHGEQKAAEAAVAQEEQERQEQAQLFDQVLDQADWDNPEEALRMLVPVAGVELATKLISSVASIRKTQQGQEPTMDDARVQVGTVAGMLERFGPEYLAGRWNVYGPALAPIAPLLGLESVPEQFTQEVAEAIPIINEQLNPRTGRGPLAGLTGPARESALADITDVAEARRAPEEPGAPTIRDLGGRIAAVDPKTGQEIWSKQKTPSPRFAGTIPEDVQADIQRLPTSWRQFNASHVTRDDFSVRGNQKAAAIAHSNSLGRVLPTKKQAAAIVAANGTIRDINAAQKLLDDPEVQTWLGRYRGTLTDFLAKGWAGDAQVPQKVRQFRANLNRLAAEERHRLYGAALTQIESRFADGFLPAITQPPAQIGSSLQEFVDDIERGMDALWGTSAGGGAATHVWTPQGIQPAGGE